VIRADELTPAAYAAAGFEIALFACGVGIILWLFLSARGRERLAARLAPWELPLVDFGCYAFFAILGFLVLSAVVGLGLRVVRLDADSKEVLGGAVQDIGLLLGLACFHLFYRGRSGNTGYGRLLLPTLKSGAVTFLVVMPLVVVSEVIWGYVLTSMGLPMENQDLMDLLQKTSSAWLVVSLVAIATLVAPVAEELIFRAGLFRYLRTRAPRWAAILATSVLFGALHVHWGGKFEGLPSLVPLTVLAAVFCVAYERTGLIGTTIVAHALFNLNTFVLVAAGFTS
jgi:membrane protease YdiL (CAAX protease family)